MDPELLQELAQAVVIERGRGRTDREINSALRRNRNFPVNSLRQLEAEMQTQGVEFPSEREEDEGLLEEAQERLAPAIQGLSFNLAPDAIAGLEKIGLAPEGAAENFRADLAESREERPIRSGASQIAGIIGTGVGGRVGTGVGKLIPEAGRRVGGLFERGAQALARRAGVGETGQLVAGGAARTAGGAAGAGGAGAVEGGLLAFGEGGAAGEPVSERGGRTAFGAGVGGLLTGALGGLGAAVGTARRIGDVRRAGGERLADAAQESGGLLGTRAVERGRARLADATRRAFTRANGQPVITEAFLTVAEDGAQAVHPAIRSVLQRSNTETSRELLRRMDDFASGKASRVITFEDADNIRKQLKLQADALARKLPDSANPQDIFRVNEAQDALNFVEEALERLPGYEEGIRLSASQNAMRRSLDAGERLRGRPAETLEAIMRGEKVRVPGSKTPIKLNTLAERTAFIEGVAEPMIQRLRGGSSSVSRFLNEVFTGTETSRKLRLVFGDDQAFNQFLQEARHVRAVNNAEGLAALGIKYAGFMTLGSSLAGGVGTTLLFGN